MLILVVGPSGAGKDTLLAGARAVLAGDERFHFVRRVITREPGVDVEDHETVTESAFQARREAGGFALWWRARGHFYGIPADVTLEMERGRVVVANVSRSVVAEAAARFPVRVIEITAPADTLARRLAARGQEDAVQAAARLARSVPLPAGIDKETVANDGTTEQGVRRLTAALTRAAALSPSPRPAAADAPSAEMPSQASPGGTG